MDKIKALLESGRTERFHTRPHHLPYSVAQHSWGMVAILEALWPDAPVILVKACLFHDCAERWTGDMPAPGKWWISPEANGWLKQAEFKLLTKLEVNYPCGLNNYETAWLKALDLLELYLYCLDEREMGNMNLGQVELTCAGILNEGWVPEPITGYVRRVKWVPTDDAMGQRPEGDD